MTCATPVEEASAYLADAGVALEPDARRAPRRADRGLDRRPPAGRHLAARPTGCRRGRRRLRRQPALRPRLPRRRGPRRGSTTTCARSSSRPRSPSASRRAVPRADRSRGRRRAARPGGARQPVPGRARRRAALVSLPPPVRRLPARAARRATSDGSSTSARPTTSSAHGLESEAIDHALAAGSIDRADPARRARGPADVRGRGARDPARLARGAARRPGRGEPGARLAAGLGAAVRRARWRPPWRSPSVISPRSDARGPAEGRLLVLQALLATVSGPDAEELAIEGLELVGDDPLFRSLALQAAGLARLARGDYAAAVETLRAAFEAALGRASRWPSCRRSTRSATPSPQPACAARPRRSAARASRSTRTRRAGRARSPGRPGWCSGSSATRRTTSSRRVASSRRVSRRPTRWGSAVPCSAGRSRTWPSSAWPAASRRRHSRRFAPVTATSGDRDGAARARRRDRGPHPAAAGRCRRRGALGGSGDAGRAVGARRCWSSCAARWT